MCIRDSEKNFTKKNQKEKILVTFYQVMASKTYSFNVKKRDQSEKTCGLHANRDEITVACEKIYKNDRLKYTITNIN